MAQSFVDNAAEICIPEPNGRGVERLKGYALLIDEGRVAWLGRRRDRPASAKNAELIDAAGGAVLPALVDCHTHLVFGGDRVEDFALRAQGTSYSEILAAGGGIHSTVEKTRRASFSELVDTARARLERRRRFGIGTTEIKSGYGLSVEHELRMLEVVRVLADEGWDVEATLLAAHVVPKDIDRGEYVRQIIEEMIPHVAQHSLARFVDVFVEKNAYSVDEARAIFAAASAHGLSPRVHADQITPGGGAELAAEVNAVSADHLERATDGGLAAMAQAGVVAVLLPGAMHFLGDSAPNLGRRCRAAGVEIAVATDHNPGSSPLGNLPLAATLATTTMGLSAEEAIRAVTLGAAHALRRDDIGTLRPGALGRLLILEHPDSRALVYEYGDVRYRRIEL